MTPKQQEALEAYEKYGSYQKAADALNAKKSSIFDLCARARESQREWDNADPLVKSTAKKFGIKDITQVDRFWDVRVEEDGSRVSMLVVNKQTGEERSFEDVINAACERVADRSPAVVKPKYDGGKHLLVVSAADIHMGKLCEAMETGDEYTLEVAERRTKEGVAGLLEMGKAFGLECITINTGDDSLHVDNSKKTTTSGTPQDTEGSIFTMFDAMFGTWVWVIEEAANYAPVHVVFDPSNHPWVSDWMLNRAVMAHFRNDERVTFDVKMNSIRHRKYQVYGSNLIGYTHGDGAKDKDLPNIMQYECREWWGKTKRGYWITKHKHHKDAKMVGLKPYQTEKDHAGVTVIRTGDTNFDQNVAVEIVRSPSGTDGWHDRNGFVGALKAVEAFLFHADRGKICNFIYPFY